MDMTHRDTVVGLFHDRDNARKAVEELRLAGFSDSQIGVAARDKETREQVGEGTGSYAGEGAAAGVAAGAGLGALWGAGILAGLIPGIGPAIAGGTLGVILSSAVAGAAVAGVAGALIGLGVPEEEAHYYEEEFKQGRILVTVKTDSRQDEARTILHRWNAYDIQSRDHVRAGT